MKTISPTTGKSQSPSFKRFDRNRAHTMRALPIILFFRSCFDAVSFSLLGCRPGVCLVLVCGFHRLGAVLALLARGGLNRRRVVLIRFLDRGRVVVVALFQRFGAWRHLRRGGFLAAVLVLGSLGGG